jgi:hypothetical protein
MAVSFQELKGMFWSIWEGWGDLLSFRKVQSLLGVKIWVDD